MKEIVTSRLILKKLNSSDIQQYYPDWLNNPDINQYLETRHSVHTIQSCIDFVNACHNVPHARLLGVYDKNTMKHIGNCKLGFINNANQSAQISLFIGEKEYWNKGLGKDIIHELSNIGFNDLNLLRIEAGCYQNNQASLRAFLSNNYNIEGLLRSTATINGKRENTYILGILKDDFVYKKT